LPDTAFVFTYFQATDPVTTDVETRKNGNKTSGTSPKQRKVHQCMCDVIYVLRCESVILKVATLRELLLLLLFFFLLSNKTTMKD